MYMLREQLKADNIATSWVNTEYSMFRGAETTSAVLRGMLESSSPAAKLRGNGQGGKR